MREWINLKNNPIRYRKYLDKKKKWDLKYRQTHTRIQKPRPWSEMTDEKRKRKLYTDKQWRLRHKDQVKQIHKKSKDLNYYGGNREKVIQRDGEKCIKCGITRKQHLRKYKRDITVDHINRLGRGVKLEIKDNRLENLQTLCISCHMRKDGRKNLEL